MHSFGSIGIRISDLGSLGSCYIKLNEPKNPFPELICRFLKCAMVRVITDPDPAHPNRRHLTMQLGCRVLMLLNHI